MSQKSAIIPREPVSRKRRVIRMLANPNINISA